VTSYVLLRRLIVNIERGPLICTLAIITIIVRVKENHYSYKYVRLAWYSTRRSADYCARQDKTSTQRWNWQCPLAVHLFFRPVSSAGNRQRISI